MQRRGERMKALSRKRTVVPVERCTTARSYGLRRAGLHRRELKGPVDCIAHGIVTASVVDAQHAQGCVAGLASNCAEVGSGSEHPGGYGSSSVMRCDRGYARARREHLQSLVDRAGREPCIDDGLVTSDGAEKGAWARSSHREPAGDVHDCVVGQLRVAWPSALRRAEPDRGWLSAVVGDVQRRDLGTPGSSGEGDRQEGEVSFPHWRGKGVSLREERV